MQKVDIEYYPYSAAEAITVKSLVKWLHNEIDIANKNLQEAKQEINNDDTDTFIWAENIKSRSEEQIECFNHLLTDLREPNYKGA
jgi:hypothetical protein